MQLGRTGQIKTMTGPEFDDEFRRQFLDLLRWRRDVREFQTAALPAGAFERLVDLASLAPSVGLSQPWRFVLVESPEARGAIRGSFQRCNADALLGYSGERAALYARMKLAGLSDAPCQFAVFADMEVVQGHGLGRQTMQATIEYSAVMAIHTLWLAARAEGIGLGWLSILDPADVAAALDVPASWKLIGYFCLGYPLRAASIPTLETQGWEARSAPVILTR